ncbi:MAG TPA: hypothetical protein VFK30_13325, partial [Anaerolineae bacterium]|nr:hypothetical protein [Anaerolineae bacterium]
NSQLPIDATPGYCLTVNVTLGQPSATLLEAVHPRLAFRITSTEFQKFPSTLTGRVVLHTAVTVVTMSGRITPSHIKLVNPIDQSMLERNV